MDPYLVPFVITIGILCACVVGVMMLAVFIVNGRLQKDVERLTLENRSLRRELAKARDELNRRPMRLAARLPRRAGW